MMNTSDMKFDMVINIGAKDIFISRTVIEQSIKNINPQRIFLISKKRYLSFFYKIAKKYQNITLVDEDDLLPGLSWTILREYISMHNPNLIYKTGWYLQQFLKMGFARSKYCLSDYYLVWDADTIPTRKINFFNHGKPKYCLKEEFHPPYFQTMYKILGFSKQIERSFIAEHMIFSTDMMKNLLDEIECKYPENNSDNNFSFWQIIINNITGDPIGFSEFETYGSYMHIHGQGSYETRELKTYRNAGKQFGRHIGRNDLHNMSDYDTISLEPADKPSLIRQLVDMPQRIIIKIISSI